MAVNNHQISMLLEMAGRRALELGGRGGLYGVIDADYIDRVGNAFTVLVASLSPYYKNASPEVASQIDSFLGKFAYLDESDLDKETYFQGVEESARELKVLLQSLYF
ncbi:hypothetical protein WQ54_15695 [Bacillus sp. SA1-12]|uniref:hypothetical protein n=1 Tax=Bacillus sp. SA1-12 TaxID=1455638 RepID=UPI00062740A5|nr:hypothetical protein [Bacillus sp. SA1-12]KKI91266.1 hypothetical protein WQ54_15695 [Bacillus sp. SA1-12]